MLWNSLLAKSGFFSLPHIDESSDMEATAAPFEITAGPLFARKPRNKDVCAPAHLIIII